MTAPRATAPDGGSFDRFRSTVELVGTLAVTVTQVVAVVGAVASVVRRRTTGCR
jgi:hypothetical protein